MPEATGSLYGILALIPRRSFAAFAPAHVQQRFAPPRAAQKRDGTRSGRGAYVFQTRRRIQARPADGVLSKDGFLEGWRV